MGRGVVGRGGCGSRVEGLWVEGVVGRASKVEGCSTIILKSCSM